MKKHATYCLGILLLFIITSNRFVGFSVEIGISESLIVPKMKKKIFFSKIEFLWFSSFFAKNKFEMIAGCIYNIKTMTKFVFPFFWAPLVWPQNQLLMTVSPHYITFAQIGHFSTLVKILFFQNIGSFFSSFLRKASLR